MSGECNICGVMGCVESNHKETNVSDAKPQSIEQLSSLTLVRILSHHTKDYPAILREFGQACFASGAAARDGEVEDWPWVDASKAHPQHGLSVAIIPEGDERIAVGFWDKELENSRRAYIVDGPNGSHHVRALWWSYLPPKPSALAPGNGGEGEK